MSFSVYSLADVITTINHPDVGKSVLSDGGLGRVTIGYEGNLAANTITATGYVVVNKLIAKNGNVGLEIPNNSDADLFLRKWIKYVKSAPTKRFALTTLTVKDSAANRTYTMTGVVPQKEPDEGYDAQSGNRQYNLLYAEMVVA